MKRLIIPIVIAIFAMTACHSKKSIIAQEYHTSDTVSVEKQRDSIVQSSFDYGHLALSFDSLIVVAEQQPIETIDTILRFPPAFGTIATYKVYGGNLDYDKKSGEALSIESEKSIENAAQEEDIKDGEEDSETQAATSSTIFSWRVIAAIIFLVLLFIFRKEFLGCFK